MKAAVRVTMAFDCEVPFEEGQTEHSGLDVQLMDFRAAVLKNTTNVTENYQPSSITFELIRIYK